MQQEPKLASYFEMHVRVATLWRYIITWTSTEEDVSKKITSGEESHDMYHWCFCKGKLLTLVMSVWGTDITSDMCLGAHVSWGNTYHCNTGAWLRHSGADLGGWIGWLATPPPPGCAVSIILILCLLSTLWFTWRNHILVNQVYDKMQIIHSDRGLHDGGRTLTAARACGLTQSN